MYLSTRYQSLKHTDPYTVAHMNSVTTALEQRHVSWEQLTISGAERMPHWNKKIFINNTQIFQFQDSQELLQSSWGWKKIINHFIKDKSQNLWMILYIINE